MPLAGCLPENTGRKINLIETMNTFIGKIAIPAIALFAAIHAGYSQPAHAQLDAEREARDLRVEVIRAKMDSIRRVRKRPTVALVLSGGGAKGSAHVGVIRYLESIGMPVDMVMGTSMGGLVGGIYALGYNAGQLDSLIRSIDWDMALSDKVPREYLSYSTVKYKEKYVLSFPFFYDRDEFMHQREDELQYPHRSREIHLGAGKEDASGLVRDNLLGSLPSGMVYGQNVNNIFSSLSVGYQDEIDFYKDLPIPFLCVATDLVTGTAKIWTKGKLNTALRSTMSIPGLFTPVKVGGMVLVDGGMRNNYPTDLAKKCGADIVIGVDLSSGYKGYADINNIGDVINTSIDMMGRTSFEKNQDLPDVSIKPDLHEYGMLSFDTESVDSIIHRGYVAALENAVILDSLKKVVGPDTTSLQDEPADDIRNTKVMVSGVEITGVSDKESSYLHNKIRVDAGTRMGNTEIENAVATIFGTNSFDYVNYELLGDSQPYRLRFNCKKGPISKVGVGVRFDTEEVVSVLLNVGWGVHKLQGSSWDLTGKIGISPAANLTYSYVTTRGMTLNFLTGIRHTDRNTFGLGANRFRINFTDLRQEVSASNIKWSKFFLKAGIRNDYFNIGSLMSEQVMPDYDSRYLKNDFVSAFVDARNYSLDDGYVPTEGHSVNLSYQWVFGSFPHRFDSFHAIQFDAMKVLGNDDIAFIPSVNVRCLLGEDIPLPFTNTIGGTMAGRYFDQQVPFIGINYSAAMDRVMGVFRMDARKELFENNYLTLIGNYVAAANRPSDFVEWGPAVSDALGIGAAYTYNTIVGPISFYLHWSSMSNRLGAFFSLGFDF